jgi:hypothetical protein
MLFLNRTAPVRRILGGLLALTLAFTSLGGANAAGPVEEVVPYYNHEVGIVNATFGLATNCLLTGWTAVGSVTTAPSGYDDCRAVISASRPTGMKAGLTTSSLEQSFVVNASKSMFRLYVRSTSDNPNNAFAAQTLTIYDKPGNILVRYVFNNNNQNDQELLFDLSAYGGREVRLKLETTVNTLVSQSPTSASMDVYFRLLYRGPNPEPGPGGGP